MWRWIDQTLCTADHTLSMTTEQRDGAFFMGCCKTLEPNSRLTNLSWPSKKLGEPSRSSPQSTRPSPPPRNVTGGRLCFMHRGCLSRMPSPRLSLTPSGRWLPSYVELKPTIMMSTRCCRALCVHADSTMPMTSQRCCDTGLRRQLHAQLDRGALARHHV